MFGNKPVWKKRLCEAPRPQVRQRPSECSVSPRPPPPQKAPAKVARLCLRCKAGLAAAPGTTHPQLTLEGLGHRTKESTAERQSDCAAQAAAHGGLVATSALRVQLAWLGVVG